LARKRIRRVVLLTALTDRTLHGIGRYVGPDSTWSFELCYPTVQSIRQLTAEPPDGIIAYLHDAGLADSIDRVGCPVVSNSGALKHSDIPRVACDSVTAGRMAAEHFLDRGFTDFAFIGDGARAFSAERRKGFSDRVGQAGHECRAHFVRASSLPTTRERSAAADRKLTSWLEPLPSPVGLFAVNDDLAWWVTELAPACGIRIPEDIAVMGMDDTVLCRLSRPPLSSVRFPGERVGYEAARVLDLLMRGKKAPAEIRIPPEGIVARQSTDILAMDDRSIAMAVRFIREHFVDDIGVDDVARAACMNRRTMEKRFRALVGRTPATEIRRIRVEAAKELLLQQDLTMDVVAARSGFSSRRWMSTVFTNATGATPGRFRRERAVMVHAQSEGEPVV